MLRLDMDQTGHIKHAARHTIGLVCGRVLSAQGAAARFDFETFEHFAYLNSLYLYHKLFVTPRAWGVSLISYGVWGRV